MRTLFRLFTQQARTPRRRRRNQSRRFSNEPLEPRWAMAAGPLVITEFMYDPAAPTQQEDDAGFRRDDFEYIELQNISGQTLSLDGFSLDDGVEFEFDAITLAPNQYVVVVRDEDAFVARYGESALIAGEYEGSLGNNNDDLVLLNPSGAEILDFTYDDQWHPTTAGDGYSLVIIDPQGEAAHWDQSTGWRASNVMGGTPGRAEGPVDQTSPSVPQGLNATLSGGAQVALQWQIASDPESGITAYRIYRNGILLETSTSNSFTDMSAVANRSYTYQVTAVNGFGLASGMSNSAALSIPPLGDTPAFADGEEVGKVTEIELQEISGLVASRKNHEVIWVHEDGAQESIVAINAGGRLLGTLTLSGVQTTDWEDIAIGPGPTSGVDYIYIGDIGDNLADRSSITLYRVPEPTMQSQPGSNQSVTLARNQFDVITLRYPAGPVDAEAVLIDPLTGDLFILAKEASPSRIFRAPASALVNGGEVVLTQVGQVNFQEPSAAEISPSGREIIVRNETDAQIFLRAQGQTVAAALAGSPFEVPVIGPPREPNGEAVGFEWSGRGYYTISEDQDPALYYFHRTSRLPGDTDPPVGGPWHNAALPTDVNGDGRVEPVDVLILINDINTNGGRQLTSHPPAGHPFIDVDANGQVTALDVLLVINYLNGTTSLAAQGLAETRPSDEALTAPVATPQDSDSTARNNALISTDWQQEVGTARLEPIEIAATDSRAVGQQQNDRLGIRERKARAAQVLATLE